MGQEIVYCDRCQERIRGVDIEKGKAVRLNDKTCCLDCLTPAEQEKFRGVRRSPTGTHASQKVALASPRPGTTRRVRQDVPAKSPAALFAGIGGGALLLILVAFVALRKGPEPDPVTGGGSTTPLPAPPGPAPAPAIKVPDARPPSDYSMEAEALKAELAEPLSQNKFQLVRSILDRAKDRYSHPKWNQTLAELNQDLSKRARSRLKELMDLSTQAVGRKAMDEVRRAREEVVRWGSPLENLLQEFDKEFSTALAAAPAPPEPVPAPAPSPAPAPAPAPTGVPDPTRSEEGKKYLDPWEKAMYFATRRDYVRAITEVQAAMKNVQADDVRKEVAADLKDLEQLRALYDEILKVMAAIPSWDEVVLEIVKEDGARLPVRQLVLQAGPLRLALRGEPRFVEIDDIAPASLAEIFLRRQGKAPEARVLALFCALDGDADAARRLGGGSDETLAPKLWNYAATVRERLPKPDAREWAARRLYYEAATAFPSMETRGAAMEKFDRLLEELAGTEFVKRTRPEIVARSEECKEYVFTAGRLGGHGIFVPQKLQVLVKKEKIDMLAWKGREDPMAASVDHNVEFRFFALPKTAYRAWVLVGGCCVTTFDWSLQGTELIYKDPKTRKDESCEPGGTKAAPWEHKLRCPYATHAGKDHGKIPKEPTIWEWAELPLPKYSTGGPKTVRFIGLSKGMAMAAAVVSASRDKRPADEELRKLAEASLEEGPPAGALLVGKGAPDLLAQIPEARGFTLACDVDLAKLSRPVKYDIDNRAAIKEPFDRIAYLIELQTAAGAFQYAYVSLDAFTPEISKIAFPDPETGARFQQKVTGMNVYSNVEGVANGTLLDGGNIEFWPNNYAPGNSAGVPGAAGDVYDWGDQITDPLSGYGSMQVHNSKAGHTIFAINHWPQVGGADLGIGNCHGKQRDWTFTANAKTYPSKRLRILVRPKK